MTISPPIDQEAFRELVVATRAKIVRQKLYEASTSAFHASFLNALNEAAESEPTKLERFIHSSDFSRLSVGDQAFAWELYAYAIERTGETDDVIKALEQSLSLNPDDADLWCSLGSRLLFRGRLEQAENALEKAESIRPASPYLWMLRGLASLMQGKEWSEVLGKFETAFRHNEKGSKARKLLLPVIAQGQLTLGLSVLETGTLDDLDGAIKGFLLWKERARQENALPLFRHAVDKFREGLAPGERKRLDAFLIGVKLMSIKDPLKGWEALGREISKRWPKGVSAVDALREQRRW